VKCITHYYCTVNHVFHTIPNDQLTLPQFIDILNTTGRHAIHDATDSVCHQTEVGGGLIELVIRTPVLSAPETSDAGKHCPTERQRTLQPISE